jgi:hypothetical protein
MNKDFPTAFSSFKKRHRPYFTTSELSHCTNIEANYKPVSPQRKMPIYGAIIRSEDGKYLLVQGRHTLKWSFPKGHSKKYETPLDCAGREIFEETGCMSLPNPCDVIKLKVATYYLFNVPSTFTANVKDTREVAACIWATREEAAMLDLNLDADTYFRCSF